MTAPQLKKMLSANGLQDFLTPPPGYYANCSAGIVYRVWSGGQLYFMECTVSGFTQDPQTPTGATGEAEFQEISFESFE